MVLWGRCATDRAPMNMPAMNHTLKDLLHLRSMKCSPLVALLLVACGGADRKAGPPEKITAAFHRLHPDAHITQWNDEAPIWEAKYTEGDIQGAVSFNAKAEVTENELVVPASAVPAPGMAYIMEHYPQERAQRCEQVTDDKGKVTFEVQITGKEIVLDAGGNFMTEEAD